jgi:hypothetical protein
MYPCKVSKGKATEKVEHLRMLLSLTAEAKGRGDPWERP